MSTFKRWTPQQIAERELRIVPGSLLRRPTITTAVSLLAEVREKEVKKKTQRLDRRPMLEAEIQDEIEDYLRTQSHRAWWDRKRMDKPTTSRKGIPDFIGSFAGTAFGLEVKRPGEKPTTDQLGELAWMRKAGAQAAVVFSKEDAVKFFNSIKP